MEERVLFVKTGVVQPNLALADALQKAGHEVLLVAPAQFEAAAQQRGILFAALPAAYLAVRFIEAVNTG